MPHHEPVVYNPGWMYFSILLGGPPHQLGGWDERTNPAPRGHPGRPTASPQLEVYTCIYVITAEAYCTTRPHTDDDTGNIYVVHRRKSVCIYRRALSLKRGAGTDGPCHDLYAHANVYLSLLVVL
jgi:hypothetical protein